MRRLLILMVTLFAVLLLGEAVPRLVIHSNIEEFAGVEGPAMQCAGLAYMNARDMVSGGPEAFVWTALRVVGVNRLPPGGNDVGRCECPYEIRVRVYTLFGVPYDTIVARCSESYRSGHP